MDTYETLFLSVGDAARRVGITPYYLRQRIAQGAVPHIHCGRKILVNLPKLVELLSAESTGNMAQSQS